MYKKARSTLYFDKYKYRTTCSVNNSTGHDTALYNENMHLFVEAAIYMHYVEVFKDIDNRLSHVDPDFSDIKKWHILCEKMKVCTSVYQDSKFLKMFPTGGFLYHNDLSMVDKLVNEFGMNLHDTIEVITRPKGTAVYLTKSNYNYRSYFITHGKINRSFTNEKKLRDYLLNLSEEEVRLSPSLSKWAKRNFNSYSNHYPGIGFLSHPNLERTMFIDHKDLQILTMIGLIFPECIRKTVDIVVDAE